MNCNVLIIYTKMLISVCVFMDEIFLVIISKNQLKLVRQKPESLAVNWCDAMLQDG